IDTAIAWHVRQADMSADDWEAFTLWLEADPAHAATFDRVAVQNRMIAGDMFVAPRAANDDAPLPGRRRGWFAGGAVAAALV
ncbi:FecR/PupR family sigma factor regulator, partial [Enterococcus faecium]|uniref:FecR/PupR family sigma factor regulator n=2 Tax=Bacteria TaxID=2 RepID=UPI003F425BC5